MSSLKCTTNVKLIKDEMLIEDVVRDIIHTGPHEDPIHVLDLDDVVRKHRSWCKQLPRVEPYYAIKCNDDPRILQTMTVLGLGFDCASKGELERMLDFGVEPGRIIFAQPAKSISSLLYARSKKVSFMTFDSAFELEKIHQHYPEAQLVLRIRHDALKVRCVLGKKFGCDPINEAPALLRKAAQLSLEVVGISFHVGSDCEEPEVYYHAIQSARGLFDYAKSVGFELSLLDIGGGFPGDRYKPIDRYAQTITQAIDRFFPVEENVRIIAEPGRFFVASAVTLVSFVESKRIVTERQEDGSDRTRIFYYLNDGIYGTFSFTHHEGQEAIPIVQHTPDARKYNSSVWGPTCDSSDVILQDILLPELHIGDSVVFENVGAYGIVRGTAFNGLPLPKVIAYLREGTWSTLQRLTASSHIIDDSN
ncbi:AGAP011806-PA-like protein [Anopheles sinensis]|uniref:ornithine decarboxylase n=1 Tax=Anopheles sinensis TaxID=74873 RepID=A0A084WAF5_ANOSI|nr:AGAP011806-PA-like protein [Anopheles sinensis]